MVKVSGSNNFKQNNILILKHPINERRIIKAYQLGSKNSDLGINLIRRPHNEITKVNL